MRITFKPQGDLNDLHDSWYGHKGLEMKRIWTSNWHLKVIMGHKENYKIQHLCVEDIAMNSKGNTNRLK